MTTESLRVNPTGISSSVISSVLAAVLSDAGKQQLEQADMQAAGGSPQDLQGFIAGEAEKWGPIIKAADIHM
jgi:tripartite-type tricarboxylate transporter receptor subunit TctC